MSHSGPIDSCLNSDAALSPKAMAPMAPTRSNQRALLKSIHHKRIANAQRIAPIIPREKPENPGTNAFTPKREMGNNTAS